jgi:hypothetical protein
MERIRSTGRDACMVQKNGEDCTDKFRPHFSSARSSRDRPVTFFNEPGGAKADDRQSSLANRAKRRAQESTRFSYFMREA